MGTGLALTLPSHFLQFGLPVGSFYNSVSEQAAEPAVPLSALSDRLPLMRDVLAQIRYDFSEQNLLQQEQKRL